MSFHRFFLNIIPNLIRYQDPHKENKVHQICFLYCVFPNMSFLHIDIAQLFSHVLDIEPP